MYSETSPSGMGKYYLLEVKHQTVEKHPIAFVQHNACLFLKYNGKNKKFISRL